MGSLTLTIQTPQLLAHELGKGAQSISLGAIGQQLLKEALRTQWPSLF